jgi:hypothetical protein
MAPTTRSKASNTGTGNVGVMTPPPLPTKVAGGKPKKSKPTKRPAAAATKPAAAPSKVQKRKKSNPKNKKGKGKNRKSSAETSVKSSSKASSRASSKKPSSKKTPRPATTVQDDFPELAQVLPFVDQADLQPASSPSSAAAAAAAAARARALRGRGRTDHVLLPDHNFLFDQLAHHMVNPPPWSHTRPGTGAGRRSNSSASSKISGFQNYLPKTPELAEGQSPWAPDFGSSNSSMHVYPETFYADRNRRREARRSRSGNSVVRDIVSQVEDQDQSEESETPVDVKNSHVFKRPTVADVRRERTMMHDELREWVKRLRRARDDFDAIIGEIESKMQIIRAVNRMQAPLRKATLGRGR